jgi:DUF1680 family protein
MAPRLVLATLALGGLCFCDAPAAEPAPLRAVPFPAVRLADDFWGPRLATNRRVTIEANLLQCERTARINNFAVAAGLVKGKHQGELYNDSDVYKVLEGIAYALAAGRDPELEKKADRVIDLIAAAQQKDGYLNTYYTLVKPKERWHNIQHGHELYCAGHLIEAAVAYHQATGKRKLLDVAIRLADHICATFGPGKKRDTCGHEELELALVKLYVATGDRKYIQQAHFFLDVRGTKEGRRLFGDYAQDHLPVRRQREVVGHAVRAMYLYCGMADVAAHTGDRELFTALEHVWRDVVERKMYLTGGIGPSAHNEGFTVPYDLPNDTAYAETCAAIGMALWNHRMFLRTGDGKYADVLEREVYNGLLSGVSLSGDRFFYTNPLASTGRHRRVPWFDCSCCPTNIVRYLPAMGERAYAMRGDGLWAVLYMAGTAKVELAGGPVEVVQRTRFPWEGEVELELRPPRPRSFELHLRVPGWCKGGWSVSVNGEAQKGLKAEKGYLTLKREWRRGDRVRLSLPMPVERVHADPRVKANVGRVALMRGPVVFCLEGVDNGGKVRNLVLPRDAGVKAEFRKGLLGGVVALTGPALSVARGDDLKPATRRVTFTAVPYYAWANRAPGEMIVWLAERPEVAELPAGEGVVVGDVLIRASHVNPTDTLAELSDDQVPKGSGDHSIRRMTWWDHRGTTEWVSYRFATPRRLTSASVYWFDDTGRGACRVPVGWRLLYLDGTTWRPVRLAAGQAYAVVLDRFNAVTFDEVNTRELRLEVTLRPGFSGGVLKWRVEGR